MIKYFLQGALVAFLLYLSSGLAQAAAPGPMYAKYGSTAYVYSNYGDACAASNTQSISFVYGGGGQCHGTYTTGGDAGWFSVPTKVQCSDGSAPDLAKPTAQQCPDPPPQCSTASVGIQQITIGWGVAQGLGAAVVNRPFTDSVTNHNFCNNGCSIQADTADDIKGAYRDTKPSASGYYRQYLSVAMHGNGSQCFGIDASHPPGAQNQIDIANQVAAPTTPPDGSGKCPAGSTPSGVDPYGMTICQGKATAPSAPASTSTITGPTTTSTDANGVKTSTSTTQVKNSDGSTTTTTTTTTTGTDGTTTVSSSSSTSDIVTPGGGTTPGKSDRPEDKTDLCQLHPELNICKNSQVQGACALVTCDGDAIQCATLRAAATIQCNQQIEHDAINAMPVKTLGDAILAGNDPNAADFAKRIAGTTVDVSANSPDTTGFLSSASCFGSRSFSIGGHSFSANFSAVCNAILPLRAAIMIVASILAYVIVARAVLK